MEETDGKDKDKDSDSDSAVDLNEDEKIRKEATRLKGPSSDAIVRFEDYRKWLYILLESIVIGRESHPIRERRSSRCRHQEPPFQTGVSLG